MCIPEHTIPWALISGGLLLGMVAIAAVADWITRHYQHREIVRRVMPRRHVHSFRLGRYVNGVTLAECACGEIRAYQEPTR